VEVSIPPDDGVQAAELMEKANAAMYCKDARRGRFAAIARNRRESEPFARDCFALALTLFEIAGRAARFQSCVGNGINGFRPGEHDRT
jgi:hypothetical protein